MTSRHRKARGYETQRFVAEYFRSKGWVYAETAGAGRPGTDITGVLGVDIEVKAVRDSNFSMTGTIKQQLDRIKDGIVPVAIVRPDGYGEARIEEWPCILPLATVIQLLKEAGYGPG